MNHEFSQSTSKRQGYRPRKLESGLNKVILIEETNKKNSRQTFYEIKSNYVSRCVDFVMKSVPHPLARFKRSKIEASECALTILFPPQYFWGYVVRGATKCACREARQKSFLCVCGSVGLSYTNPGYIM